MSDKDIVCVKFKKTCSLLLQHMQGVETIRRLAKWSLRNGFDEASTGKEETHFRAFHTYLWQWIQVKVSRTILTYRPVIQNKCTRGAKRCAHNWSSARWVSIRCLVQRPDHTLVCIHENIQSRFSQKIYDTEWQLGKGDQASFTRVWEWLSQWSLRHGCKSYKRVGKWEPINAFSLSHVPGVMLYTFCLYSYIAAA